MSRRSPDAERPVILAPATAAVLSLTVALLSPEAARVRTLPQGGPPRASSPAGSLDLDGWEAALGPRALAPAALPAPDEPSTTPPAREAAA